MKIITIPVQELSDSDYWKCHSLNARQAGQMRGALVRARRDNLNAKISLAKEKDLLIGWAFAYKAPGIRYPFAHFYVRKTHRKNGVGRILMGEMLNNYTKLRVYPHNDQSSIFFCEYRTSLVTSRYSRQMLTNAAKKKYSS